jgi:hypothetical protein
VDLEKDVVRGHWTPTRAGGLQSDSTPKARLIWPYRPPTEYDYAVKLVRISGPDCVGMVFGAGAGEQQWAMGAMHNSVCRFAGGDEVKLSLDNNREYVALVRVRASGIEAYIDGRLISRMTRDTANAGKGPAIENMLGIGTEATIFVIHAAKVQEISGKGTFSR